MRILCTVTGKFGDAIWQLATAKALINDEIVYGANPKKTEKVDIMLMSNMESLVPLIQSQSWVGEVTVNKAWVCTGSPHGDQPWYPQNANELEWDYDKVYHLGYRHHPGITGSPLALIDFIASQQGLHLTFKTENPLPYLEAEDVKINSDLALPNIAYAFNKDYPSEKNTYFSKLQELTYYYFTMTDVAQLDWKLAASVIKSSVAFVGCMSANWVLACAVGQKNIHIYEPNPNRNILSHFGKTFGCPYVDIFTNNIQDNNLSEVEAELTFVRLRTLIERKRENETVTA